MTATLRRSFQSMHNFRVSFFCREICCAVSTEEQQSQIFSMLRNDGQRVVTSHAERVFCAVHGTGERTGSLYSVFTEFVIGPRFGR